MRKIWFISLLFLTACSLQAVPAAPAVIMPSATVLTFATATLVPTFTPRAGATTAVPTVAPTLAPITALLTNQVNVRGAPDKNATSLGLLNYGASVLVIGRNASGDWLQIVYPENSVSSAWVSAAYVQLAEDQVAKIAVRQVETASPVVVGTATISALSQSVATSIPGASPVPTVRTASVKAQIFVRSGPGQIFESLGTLEAGTFVTLTGRSLNNVWVQIQYDGGAGGKGWVAAAYLVNADLQSLPYFDNQGILIAAQTPMANTNQPTLTATAYSAAAADTDSEKSPAVRLKFAQDGEKEFSFSSELSAPSGDATDWVAFTPYEPSGQATYIYLKLECSGNGGVTVALEKDGLPVADAQPLVCGMYDFAVRVLGGQEYMLVLNADGSGGPLRYARYILSVSMER